MIYSLQDKTNSKYKHLVNSRFELFRKQDTKSQHHVCFVLKRTGGGGADPLRPARRSNYPLMGDTADICRMGSDHDIV